MSIIEEFGCKKNFFENKKVWMWTIKKGTDIFCRTQTTGHISDVVSDTILQPWAIVISPYSISHFPYHQYGLRFP